MDVIVVPESASSGPTHGASGASSPMSHWLALFILGFIMLASSSALGVLVPDSGFKAARKFGTEWAIELLALLSALGYLVATTGALMGVFRSKASVTKRLVWFSAAQAVALLLWSAPSLH